MDLGGNCLEIYPWTLGEIFGGNRLSWSRLRGEDLLAELQGGFYHSLRVQGPKSQGFRAQIP